MNKRLIIIVILLLLYFFIFKKFMTKKVEETEETETDEKETTIQAGQGKGNGTTGAGGKIIDPIKANVFVGANITQGQKEIRRSTPAIVRKKTNRNALIGKL
jgi:flagellar biosynthesis/type III secretory pathway M-ring protein FliF/YscJ